jgi:hypothetical protein
MKQIAIKVAGTESDPYDIYLQPGQTAGEVLEGLNLQGYRLSFPNSTKFFGDTEVLYPAVVDGEKLEATTLTKVGVRLSALSQG